MLRMRYVFAGVVVPAVLVSFFAISMAHEDPRMLGNGANIMLFLVGWHYVKQGYGMLIVDSVLKRQFFTEVEKKVFLANAYACWIYYWILGERANCRARALGTPIHHVRFP